MCSIPKLCACFCIFTSSNIGENTDTLTQYCRKVVLLLAPSIGRLDVMVFQGGINRMKLTFNLFFKKTKEKAPNTTKYKERHLVSF